MRCEEIFRSLLRHVGLGVAEFGTISIGIFAEGEQLCVKLLCGRMVAREFRGMRRA
jgi:hypothetical protein